MKIEYHQDRPEVHVGMELAIQCAHCGGTLEADMGRNYVQGTLSLQVQSCKPCRAQAEYAAKQAAREGM
mgnify:CR=1 FL=1